MKKSKKIIFLLVIIILILLIIFSTCIDNKKDKDITNKVSYEYSKYVITNKDTDIYLKDNNEYMVAGKISKDTNLELDDISDKYYYKISNMDKEYYINIKDTSKIDNINTSNRYKNYIVFNESISTSDKTIFYDIDGREIISINDGYILPIIVKEDDYYGVEYLNRLLYVKKENTNIIEANNTNLTNTSGIGVFNYHAFYDEGDNTCTTSICHSKKQFKEQLDYFKENNILTLRMKEVEDYIDGKINLPKSILITIDDGGRTDVAVDLLTLYQMNATIFLVTSWYDPNTFNKSEYIELHSHTDNMHNTGECPVGQGGAITCKDKDYILSDLKKSRDKLGGTTYFAYPFYEYNDYSENLLKEAGFTMAFIGESTKSDNLVHPKDNKFRLRRFVIVDYTTTHDIDNYLSKIK